MNNKSTSSTPKQKALPWLVGTLVLLLAGGGVYLIGQQMMGQEVSIFGARFNQETSTESEESSSSTTTFTGSECEETNEIYCAELNTPDWMTWCNSQVEAWRAAGVDAINPCANSKYAHDSCTENAVLNHEAGVAGYEDVDLACIDYMDALNTSSADVQTACLYTTKPGGVCEGITPKPVTPGTKPEDVVVPLDDCLEEHYDTLTVACQEAFDFHAATSRGTSH